MRPSSAAATHKERHGFNVVAEPCLGAAVSASLVVTVLTCGATVVPGIVLAGSVVVTVLIVLPAETIALVIVAGSILGGIVVPGMVVVYVTS